MTPFANGPIEEKGHERQVTPMPPFERPFGGRRHKERGTRASVTDGDFDVLARFPSKLSADARSFGKAPKGSPEERCAVVAFQCADELPRRISSPLFVSR